MGSQSRGVLRWILCLLCSWVFVAGAALGQQSAAAPPDSAAATPESAHADSIAQTVAMMREGRFEEAAAFLRGFLARSEATFGPSSPQTATTLDQLVMCLWRLGQSQAPETNELAERAISLKEQLYSPDDPEVATSLFNLGVIRTIGGDFKAADPIFTRVLAIREAHFPPGHHTIASSINALANVKAYGTDYAGALPLYRRSLAMAEAWGGPLDPQAVSVRGNVASTLVELGEYTEAQALLRRQIDMLEAEDMVTEDLAYAYSLLAAIYFHIGDHEEAVPLRLRSLEIREAVHPEGHPRIAESLLNLGSELYMLGNYAEALSYVERGRAIWEGIYGQDHPYLGSFLESQGRIAQAMGDLPEARRLTERVLALREQGFGPDSPHVAEVLRGLADIEREDGQLDRAREHLTRALEIAGRRLEPGHPWIAGYASDLARVEFLAGNLHRAAELALQAENGSREHLRLTMGALPERQALRYAQERSGGLDLLLSLLDELDDADRFTALALDAVVRSRALVLDEIAARNRRLALWADSGVEDQVTALRHASTRLANLYVQGPGDHDAETYERLLVEARRALEDAERSLAEAGGPSLSGPATPDVGWEEIRRGLPPGSALVAYVLYERAVGGRGAEGGGSLPAYRVFVQTAAGQDPVQIDLGPAAGIDALIAAWKDEVSLGPARSDRSAAQTLAAYERAGAALREAIWDPAAARLEGVERVFVVPDGQIHLVNLAALPDGAGGYLVESDPALHCLSAEREIVLLPAGVPHAGGALVLGAPDFERATALAAVDPAVLRTGEQAPGAPGALFRGQRPECGVLHGLRFSPLPGSLTEVREVAALWETRLVSGGDIEGRTEEAHVVLRTGPDASEEALKRLAPGNRLLHVATHGYFLNGACPSGLVGTRGIGLLAPLDEHPGAKEPPTQPAERGPQARQAVQNPLLLSGLALAGANRREEAGPEGEDGILTAQEIAALDLTGVRWAVLSACETGTGEVLSGEGVFGLRRAFRIAGARTLVASLWAVRDDDARLWMEAFYRGLAERRLDTIDAVREASRSSLRERRARGESTHPFHWAAFLASGDWR
jgi:CHAT domain-containing protein/tetratricopeptide (TPR) repeat protein